MKSRATIKDKERICPCELSDFCEMRTDREIIEFVKVNKECFVMLVKRYEAKLTRYIRRISGVSKESIEDILQTVFLKAYENINSFDSKKEFSPWIYGITHNETINYWRKNLKRNTIISLDNNEFLKNIISNNTDLDSQVSQKIDGQKIAATLSKMNSRHRDALMLRFMDELTYQEISEKLKKPIGTVGTLINRGKKILQEELVRIGFSSGIS